MTKLSDDDLKQVKSNRYTVVLITEKVSEMFLQKTVLDDLIQKLQNEFLISLEKEQNFIKQLNEKYGEGLLDIETGEIRQETDINEDVFVVGDVYSGPTPEGITETEEEDPTVIDIIGDITEDTVDPVIDPIDTIADPIDTTQPSPGDTTQPSPVETVTDSGTDSV